MKLLLLIFAFFLIFLITSGNSGDNFRRPFRIVPWTKRNQRTQILGNLSCYEFVDKEGRKVMRPYLSDHVYKYCVKFVTAEDTFLTGYPLNDTKIEELFNGTTRSIPVDSSPFRFRPSERADVEFCYGSDGCNDADLYEKDNY